MFTVLRSSAGAGKTHALVKEYLARCLATERTDAYRQVLALTFTTKAAGEMRQRVLDYLRDLARGSGESPAMDDVRGTLMKAGGIDADELRQRAAAVLSHMLHHWSDVAISTIDAFTRRLLKPFARDLELDHDLQMTTEESTYLDRAVAALLDRAGCDEEVTRLLTRTCLRLLEEEQKWRPDKPLRFLAGELQRERSVAALKALEHLHVTDHLRLEGDLAAQVARFREQVRELGRRGLSLLEEAGIPAADLFQGARGLPGYLEKLSRYDGSAVPQNSYVRKMMDGGKWTSAKADAASQAAVEGVRPVLEDLCLKADSLLAEGLRRDLVRRAILRDLLATGSLQELARHVQEEKDQDGVTFFSDLTRRAARLVSEEPVPFIHERLGERFRHYLIDEFQDTSLMQWHSLLPLVENALATGGSAFLVGDGKQAIYRWRNGEVRQFLELPGIFAPEGLADAATISDTLRRNHREREPLRDNYRSGRAIIAFNNELFGRLGARLHDPELRGVYDGHEQEAGRSHEGHVWVELLPERTKDPDDEAPPDQRLERMASMVLQALSEGHAAGDIAVLVRTGAQGRQVAHRLMQEGIAIVSPDALRLGGDPAVEFVLDMLRFLHARDMAAATRAVQHLAMLRAGDDGGTVEPFPAPLDADPAHFASEFLRMQQVDGAASAPAELIHRILVGAGIDPASDAYCVTLLDEAHAYTGRHGADLAGFLDHWERTGSIRSIRPPEHGRAVQIMTIHRSKGLQFPVVIMPWTDMKGSRQQDTLWIAPGDSAPELPTALVRASKALGEAGVPEVLAEEDLKELDELDLLYVGFTRAEERLMALISPSQEDLLEALPELGAEGYLERGMATEASPASYTTPLPSWKPAQYGDLRTLLTLRREAPESWSAGDPDPFRSHGALVHELMADVRTADDLAPALDRAVRQGLADEDLRVELFGRLERQLRHEALAPYFASGQDVRTEAPLITANGRTLRPDRVVFTERGTHVLDIKTGVPRESHSEQVREYVRVLREAGEERVNGALWYLRTGEVVNVAT